MERSTDYDYKEVITEKPRAYCLVLYKLCKKIGWEAYIDYSRTSKSVYMTIYDINTKIRIADHKRMGWPPYKGSSKVKKWWQFWK